MRLIDADVLKEELSSLSVTITGLRAGKGVLSGFMEEYRKSILRIIDEQATIEPESKPLEAFLHPIDAYKGLKAKYLVFKANTGERVDNCFVLRPDKDPAAIAALRAYAATTDNKILTEDIYNWVGKGESLRPQGEWVWKHRHHGGFHRYTGVDDFGNTHTITVDERFECDEPYCPNCGKWNESVFLNYCPNCGAYMKGAGEDADS